MMTDEPTTDPVRSLQSVPKDGKLNARMSVESRPSRIDGISFYLVLSYKDWSAERMLPRDFMALDEVMRSLTVAPIAEALRLELKPILDAEDDEAAPVPEPKGLVVLL
jgi:hypothetical protein